MATRRRRSTSEKSDRAEPDESEYRARDDDDYEDDKPERTVRRRRSSSDDDYEDDKPRGRSRSRSRDDDDDDGRDERPRRGRSRSRDDDDEDDDPPRRSRSRSREDDDDDRDDRKSRYRRRASSDDDDDDDDDVGLDDVTRSGWEGYKQTKKETSSFADNFKFDSDEQIVAFLDDEPFATWGQHWVTRTGKRSFVCIGEDKGCPLCAASNPTRPMAAFNIVVLEQPPAKRGQDPDPRDAPDPKVMVLDAGPQLTDILLDAHEGKYGPLNDGYWELHSTTKGKGDNKKTTPVMNNVKERDLETDWSLFPLTTEEFEELEKESFTRDKYLQIPTRKELTDIVKESMKD